MNRGHDWKRHWTSQCDMTEVVANTDHGVQFRSDVTHEPSVPWVTSPQHLPGDGLEGFPVCEAVSAMDRVPHRNRRLCPVYKPSGDQDFINIFIFRKGTCGGQLVSPPSPLGPQWIWPVMKQFDQLGVKNSTVQQSLSWVWVWLFQIPAEEGESKGIIWQCYREIETWVLIHARICLFMEGSPFHFGAAKTCSGRKCYVKSGCCLRMQRPVVWWTANY